MEQPTRIPNTQVLMATYRQIMREHVAGDDFATHVLLDDLQRLERNWYDKEHYHYQKKLLIEIDVQQHPEKRSA